MSLPLMSKRRYWAVLNRTIKSYPKDILFSVFEGGTNVITLNHSGDLQISTQWSRGKPRKIKIELFDRNRKEQARQYRLLPNEIRTLWPTLPLWEKAIRDAIKKRLINLSLR